MVHRRPLPTKGERMIRRIVYIATTAAPLAIDGYDYIHTTALCSDGTVWQHIEGERAWSMLPEIPPRGDEIMPDIDADTDMREIVL